MTLIDHYRAMARYNSWMNRRLYGLCAERLDDGQRKLDMGAFFRSIHGTLNHLLLTDRVWLLRLAGDPERYASRDADGRVIEIRGLDQELYADFEQLRRERERTDADIEQWIGGLSADDLGRTVEYGSMTGGRFAHPLWWALSHLFNHQTHHRGQVTTLLMQQDIDPGVTDLIAMLRA